jgi:hypothetical protein
MREIMHIAHEFLQNFCRNNTTNQSLLHRKLDLFLQSGDSVRNSSNYLLAYYAGEPLYSGHHWGIKSFGHYVYC